MLLLSQESDFFENRTDRQKFIWPQVLRDLTVNTPFEHFGYNRKYTYWAVIIEAMSIS